MIRKLKNIFHLLEAIFWNVYYGFPSNKLTVIGVTGTEGKTTTVNLIHHISTTAGIKTGILSTLSSAHMTTPGRKEIQKFLFQCVKNKCTHVILEVSSHAIDQNRIWGMPFQIGVLTNITGNEHLDYHKNFENYQETKIKFLESCQTLILNSDDPSINMLVKRSRHKYVNYSLKDWNKYNYENKLPGDFNRYNILAAAAVVRQLGISEEIIKKAVLSFELPPGRFEIVVKKPVMVIVDFGHTPQSFEKILPLARTYLKDESSKLFHVFGATGDRFTGKRPIMAKVSAKFSNMIILTHEDTYSEDLKSIVDQVETGIPKGFNYLKIYDRKEAIKKALELAKPGDVVIITGVGHQKSLNIAGREVPWSDQETVKKLMKNLSES
ncbi:MAG: UDP-N-acetylmuramoyl-L-alanyl-D-glutamate--2,6-diaminopimelate ligase [bacterium]|nr:UDP-N-acetylmuramoyl-L-alanyl-D-glutamate--2,6-diaminopimelate ligase [bacterium]